MLEVQCAGNGAACRCQADDTLHRLPLEVDQVCGHQGQWLTTLCEKLWAPCARGGKEMIYLFRCEGCGLEHKYQASIKQGPPPDTACWECGDGILARVWTPVNFICDSDPDYIKPDKRVFDTMDRRSEPVKEAAFQRHIDERRALVREAGHNPKAMRQTHSVPADLFHGKIRESGDKEYWDDPSNLKKHSSCKVD